MKRHIRYRPRRGDAGEVLESSALIDVVFLLLIFFVFTVSPVDVYAHLDANRPHVPKGVNDIMMLRIEVLPQGYALNGVHLDAETLRSKVLQVAAYDPDQTVMMTCDRAADHGRLIAALDLCREAGLRDVALTSR